MGFCPAWFFSSDFSHQTVGSKNVKEQNVCLRGYLDVPHHRTPSWEIPVSKPYITWVFMGYNPQESLENAINTMGTLLGVHPIVPWNVLPKMVDLTLNFCHGDIHLSW